MSSLAWRTKEPRFESGIVFHQDSGKLQKKIHLYNRKLEKNEKLGTVGKAKLNE